MAQTRQPGSQAGYPGKDLKEIVWNSPSRHGAEGGKQVVNRAGHPQRVLCYPSFPKVCSRSYQDRAPFALLAPLIVSPIAMAARVPGESHWYLPRVSALCHQSFPKVSSHPAPLLDETRFLGCSVRLWARVSQKFPMLLASVCQTLPPGRPNHVPLFVQSPHMDTSPPKRLFQSIRHSLASPAGLSQKCHWDPCAL